MESEPRNEYFPGYVDGVFNESVRGWVMDPEDPERLVTVCIKVNHRMVGRTCAIHYREDVAEQFGTSGRHGIFFRLPPEYRGKRCLKIEIVCDNGLPLSNRSYRFFQPMKSEKRILPDRTGPQMLYLHLPKTGGTAFRSLVYQAFTAPQRLWVYSDPPGLPVESICHLTEPQLRQCHIIYGHFFYGLHEQLPGECRYITVLRDPVKRLISHYFHQLRRNPESTGALRIEEPPPCEELDNLMVRMIAGEHLRVGEVTSRTLYKAVRNIDRHFDFAGLMEDPDTWNDLRDFLGLRGEMIRENVGDYDASGFDTPEWSDYLKRITAYDQELYRYVQKIARERRRPMVEQLQIA